LREGFVRLHRCQNVHDIYALVMAAWV